MAFQNRARPSLHESEGTHLPTSHPSPARNLCLGIRGSVPEQGAWLSWKRAWAKFRGDLTEKRGLLRAFRQRQCCGGGHRGRS